MFPSRYFLAHFNIAEITLYNKQLPATPLKNIFPVLFPAVKALQKRSVFVTVFGGYVTPCE